MSRPASIGTINLVFEESFDSAPCRQLWESRPVVYSMEIEVTEVTGYIQLMLAPGESNLGT